MKLLARLMCLFGLVSVTHGQGPALREGDCWLYRTRDGEQGSFLVIRKIEDTPGAGQVAHISVFRLHVKSPAAPGGYTDQIGHLPISIKALRKSVTSKTPETPPQTDWRAGYDSWKAAKGGVFTESVSKCVEFVEQAISRGQPKT